MSTWFERRREARRERRRRRIRAEKIAAPFILLIVALVGWFLGAQVWGVVKEPITALLRQIDTNAPR